MSDPAVEAAARDWAMYKDVPFDADSLHGKRLIETAREALKPLRDLHRRFGRDRETVCHECRSGSGDFIPWPCATARLVYSESELAQ